MNSINQARNDFYQARSKAGWERLFGLLTGRNYDLVDYNEVRKRLSNAYKFITKVLDLPVNRLWATVYEEDDEAYKIWRDEIGMPEERIVRLGKDDNFWEIGTGPCGPCSEIYFDRGSEFGCDNPDCKPGCECDRYVEFWNHVFTQFDNKGDGTYGDLKHKNIDTGMGLERLACITTQIGRASCRERV